jgi:hypothetical protein
MFASENGKVPVRKRRTKNWSKFYKNSVIAVLVET